MTAFPTFRNRRDRRLGDSPVDDPRCATAMRGGFLASCRRAGGAGIVPQDEGRNRRSDRARWVLCVYPVVYPVRRRNLPSRAHAIQQDSRKLLGKCGWERTSEHGPGVSSQRPRVQVPSTPPYLTGSCQGAGECPPPGCTRRCADPRMRRPLPPDQNSAGTTAPSSSTGRCSTIAGARGSPSPGAGPTGRTTVRRWSRRTAPSSGPSSGTIGTPPARPMLSWRASIACCADTPTSFSPCSVSSRSIVRAPGCIASTIAPRPRISASSPNPRCPGRRRPRSSVSTRPSPHYNSGDISMPRWPSSGASPPVTPLHRPPSSGSAPPRRPGNPDL